MPPESLHAMNTAESINLIDANLGIHQRTSFKAHY
jgi:hypothetical protein